MKLVSASLVAAVVALAATQFAAPATTAGVVVRTTIWPNLDITFSPKTFKRGTIVFKVKNRAAQPHKFSINGVVSASISPRSVASVTVTFKRKATYTATLADCGYPTQCIGGNPDYGPSGSVKVT